MVRRRAGDQGPHRCFADLLQAYRVGHPAGRLGGVRRRSQLLRNAAEDDLRLFPGLVTRSPRKVCRQPAPAGQSGEQSVHGPLQHRRAIAQLGGLCDRLVDDRIERRDPPRRARVEPAASPAGPASANVSANPRVISADSVATSAASRCGALPKSVPARTMPAHTMPMQISLARVMASMKTCPSGPPVAPNVSLPMIAAVNPASAAA